MRPVVSLLLIAAAALSWSAEASVVHSTDLTAPVETHVPSELAEESEIEEMRIQPDVHIAHVLQPVLAREPGHPPPVAHATPPTPPPR